MSKWFGRIGFYETVDEGNGVYNAKIVTRNYYGDVLRNSRRYNNSGQINDDITVSVQVSIISDHFVNQRLSNIKYVEYMGTKWTVTEINPENYPRLILTLGGVYNGDNEEE